MTTPAVAPVPQMQFFDDDGEPLAGGWLYTYQAGTVSLQTVYKTTSLSGGASWTNPIHLDSAGRVGGAIFPPITPAIKYVLQDADHVVIWTQDTVIAVAGAS